MQHWEGRFNTDASLYNTIICKAEPAIKMLEHACAHHTHALG